MNKYIFNLFIPAHRYLTCIRKIILNKSRLYFINIITLTRLKKLYFIASETSFFTFIFSEIGMFKNWCYIIVYLLAFFS